MRFVLCIMLAALPPSFAFAAKGIMTLSEAQAAAATGERRCCRRHHDDG